MAKMKDYNVVTGTDLKEFLKLVDSFLPDYELIGGIAPVRNSDTGVVAYYQAIAKPARARKKA